MNIEKRKEELVNEFSPMIEKNTLPSKIWMGVLVAIILVGLYAFFVQVSKGHVVTGMRDNVVWGDIYHQLYFFVGVSYSGAFISGVLRFFHTPWKNSVSRIIEIVTVLSLVIGPIFILSVSAAWTGFITCSFIQRIQSPITWDIIAIMTDLVGCFLYLYMTFIPDFAIMRDNATEDTPAWKKKMYKFLAIGYQDTESQRTRLHKMIRIMSAMIIAMAIVAYSVLAWIFSLTVQPGWNSSIFAPYFIIAGLYSGVGVIIIAMYMIRKYFHLEKYIRKTHFQVAGFVLLVMSLLFGYFTFSEYFSRWFSHKEPDVTLLNTLFNRYFLEFIFANYIGVIVPIIILSFKKLRTVKWISFAAVVAVLGLWLNRYLIVVPTLETPYLPIQDTRPEVLDYSATWVEWALTFAGIAAFLLFFTIIIKFVPVIPMSGIIDNEREEMENKMKNKNRGKK
ncbi:MAG: NrfD/PsrC family molybdoenzyme membrane anchor subunit [Flavobacteriaceae bacterium]|nr:NrfD/PsrC family molybdoenzyme membrane anchor subunit [Flavobacteriaceae bacterium]